MLCINEESLREEKLEDRVDVDGGSDKWPLVTAPHSLLAVCFSASQHLVGKSFPECTSSRTILE